MMRLFLITLVLSYEVFSMDINTFLGSHAIDHICSENSRYPETLHGFESTRALLSDSSLNALEKEQVRLILKSYPGGYLTSNGNINASLSGPIGLFSSAQPITFEGLSPFKELVWGDDEFDIEFSVVGELSVFNYSPNKALVEFINRCVNVERLGLPFHSEPILADDQLVLPVNLEELSISNAAVTRELVEKLKRLKSLHTLILDSCYHPIGVEFEGDLSELNGIKVLKLYRASPELYRDLISNGHASISNLSVTYSFPAILDKEMRDVYKKNIGFSLFQARFPKLTKLEVNFERGGKRFILGRRSSILVEAERFESQVGSVIFNFYNDDQEKREIR